MPKIFNKQIEIVPDYEVIRQINTNPGRYVSWVGAGVSVEARVKTGSQICEDLRKRLAEYEKPANEDEWAKTELNWDDLTQRYSTCLQRYGGPAIRVRYFRQLIQGLPPCFSHHAVALLMQSGYFARTCLTTNFDKLLEIAFAQQGESECQPIRADDEAEFWRHEEDKSYVLKLHGDYDTHNILNTNEETARIPAGCREIVATLAKQSGLVVVGSAGYEESVVRLFNDLADSDDPTTLNMGLYWSVNVGPRQDGWTQDQIEQQVAARIRDGAVSRQIVEIMDLQRQKATGRRRAFFPVFGAGEFFFQLVKSTNNKAVIGNARRYLDHQMRLRHLFASGGWTPDAIEKRLNKLDRSGQSDQKQALQELNLRSKPVTRVWRATGKAAPVEIDVLYGDLTSRSLMGSDRYPAGRRAVVSPDDTFVSASGGAALALLKKAGTYKILNELSKFTAARHRDVVVTSGGELPVQYIFHAAATNLDKSGVSTVTKDDVTATMRNVFQAAVSLNVSLIFVPLIASGLEGMSPDYSMESILLAAKEFGAARTDYPIWVTIVVLDEGTLARKDAGMCLNNILGGDFTIEKAAEKSATA